MVGVLMGDEDVPDGMRIDPQPIHLLCQPVIVVSGIDHNGGITLAVKEDICHPLPHTGDIFIDPHSIRHIEDHFKYRQAVMEAYPCGHYPVFEGYNHMQYQIRDPRGFAEMLTSIAEHDGMPKLPFIRK